MLQIILEKLKEKNINAEIVNFSGKKEIVIEKENSNVRPAFWEDDLKKMLFENEMTTDELVQLIITNVNNTKTAKIVKFLENIKNNDIDKNRLKVGVRKITNDDIITKPLKNFKGLEAYIYYCINSTEEMFGTKITKELIKIFDIKEEKLWKIAKENTIKDVVVNPENVPSFFTQVYTVLSNKEVMCGASSIIDVNALKEIAKKEGTKRLIVLPSSIHEVFIINPKEDDKIEDFNKIVAGANKEIITDKDFLYNSAFEINVDELVEELVD